MHPINCYKILGNHLKIPSHFYCIFFLMLKESKVFDFPQIFFPFTPHIVSYNPFFIYIVSGFIS